jgi:hypothetical protein
MASSQKRLPEMKISVVLNKRGEQTFPQKGFSAVLMSSIFKTSNFSPAIRVHGYNKEAVQRFLNLELKQDHRDYWLHF